VDDAPGAFDFAGFVAVQPVGHGVEIGDPQPEGGEKNSEKRKSVG
jgi:hypothetical protein